MNTRPSFFHLLQKVFENDPPSRSHRFLRLLRWLMPNGGTLLLVALLIVTQSVWARPVQSVTSAPGPSATTVNYQGRLANSGGTPLTGTYGMTFALYDAASGGNLIWGPEPHVAVPVSNGLFSVGLGSQTSGGIPTSVWNGDRYLEITVGGETLAPRELIRSVPIAGMALTVPDGAIGSTQIANGSITRAKVNFAVTELYQPPLHGGGCHDLIAHLQAQGFTRCVYASSPGSPEVQQLIWYKTTDCSGTGTVEPDLWQKFNIWNVSTRPGYPTYIKSVYADGMPYLVCAKNP